jgi:hypothetical protein
MTHDCRDFWVHMQHVEAILQIDLHFNCLWLPSGVASRYGDVEQVRDPLEAVTIPHDPYSIWQCDLNRTACA